MNRKVTLIICLAFLSLTAFCQKQLITSNTNQDWQRLGESGISNNGKYIYFCLTIGSGKDSLIVRATGGAWHTSLPFSPLPKMKFTSDSKFLVFQKRDTLCLLHLGTGRIEIIRSGVESFKTPTGKEGKWLTYRLQTGKDSLILRNLYTAQERHFNHAREYRFNEEGNALFINDDIFLSRIDLEKNKEQILVTKDTIRNLVFDAKTQRAAIFVNRRGHGEIRYFQTGFDSTRLLVNDLMVSNISGVLGISSEQMQFTSDGQNLLYQLRSSQQVLPHKSDAPLKIWSYQDEMVLSRAPLQGHGSRWMVQDVSSHQPIQIANDSQLLLPCTKNYLLTYSMRNGEDSQWKHLPVNWTIVNIRTGVRKIFDSGIFPGIGNPLMAPDDNFLVWFDNSDFAYHSYDIVSGINRVISSTITVPLYDKTNDVPSRRIDYGVAGWEKDGSVLVYDQFDIWKLDPSCKKAAICLSKSYGRNHGIMLRRVVDDPSKSTNEIIQVKNLLLTGFNPETKQNGFFELSLENGRLRAGTQGNYLYTFFYNVPNFIEQLCKNLPIKAQDAPVWLVTRMSATESPNLFLTSDFLTFKPVSDIHPEHHHHWLTSELIRWKLPDGRQAEGILYKPENFDPNKKYPVIFHFYEKLSDLLNWFPGNEASELTSGIDQTNGIIPVARYISHGYLVFVPNIYYKTAHITESVTSSIRSAVDKLADRSYIDFQRLGLQGHSFGAFETVTLITKLHLFAAAQASDGYYNSTSYYNHVFPGGGSYRNNYFDFNQGNLACTPWECPETYIQNSPIFHVQDVQTPLLLLHNSGDRNVPVTEGIALFVSMRRLGKPVWLLDYGENEGHLLEGESAINDFTLREEAFFDHYLKGKPMPDWMSLPDSNVVQLLKSNSK